MDKHERAYRIFEAGQRAHAAELRRCMRDKRVWLEQLGEAVISLLKMATASAMPAAACALAGYPPSFGILIGLAILMVHMLISPGFYIRDVFMERADRAYELEVERLANSPDEAPGGISA